MNLTDDYILKFQRGAIVLFEDVCALLPITLGKIVDVGYSTFLKYLKVITLEKPVLEKNDENNELVDFIDAMSSLQYLILLATQDQELNNTIHEAYEFFTGEQISFSINPAEIIVGDIGEKHIINEDNYSNFQDIIKTMFCLKDPELDDIIIYDSDSEKVKKLKKQMLINREKVAEAKRKKNNGNSEESISFSDLVGSVALAVPGLNMINIWDLTYYSFQDQLKRMGWKEGYNTNTRAALAGAKIPKNQLKHWIRSITSSTN